MNNTLMVYLNKRLNQNEMKYSAFDSEPGPVICISREVGCGGLNIAKLLAAELDKLTLCKKWRVISKEILEESALELDMAPAKLQSILKEGNRGLFDDLLNTFSDKRNKSDRKISKTIVDLVSSFAKDGHCIIVGRAGHIIARDIEKSLLVKITAPLEWRILKLMEKNNLKRNQAIEFIEKTEKERQSIRRYIAGDILPEDEFDMTINISRFKIQEAITLIKLAAQTKGLLQNARSKVEVF